MPEQLKHTFWLRDVCRFHKGKGYSAGKSREIYNSDYDHPDFSLVEREHLRAMNLRRDDDWWPYLSPLNMLFKLVVKRRV